jgi:hypothetical protein
MTVQESDFWGEIEEADSTLTPSMILKQQAALLGAKTKHLLEAEVRTIAQNEYFYHHFCLIVPTLDNYTYELFRVSHKIGLYPVTVNDSVGKQLKTEEDFKEWVHQKLSSLGTKQLLANLLSLART